nr:hypothetical protein [Candidatus Kuenenia stuttgartiensis]
MAIFAGINGFLDDIPVDKIKKFEKEFLAFMKQKHASISLEINEKKKMTRNYRSKLENAIREFKQILTRRVSGCRVRVKLKRESEAFQA